MERLFARLALDGDGKVEQGEFARSYCVIEQRFGEVDRNHSGTVDRREWRGQPGKFHRADDDHHGEISSMEFFGVN